MTRHIYLVKRLKMRRQPPLKKTSERTNIMTALLLKKEQRKLEKQRKLRLKQLEEDIEAVNRAIAVAESGFKPYRRADIRQSGFGGAQELSFKASQGCPVLQSRNFGHLGHSQKRTVRVNPERL